MVQWLRLHSPNAGGPGSIPGQGTRSHMLQLRVRMWQVKILCDPLDCTCQALLSMGFSRQEYSSGLPCPPPVDLPDPGIKPASLTSPALAGKSFTTSATWEAHTFHKPKASHLIYHHFAFRNFTPVSLHLPPQLFSTGKDSL